MSPYSCARPHCPSPVQVPPHPAPSLPQKPQARLLFVLLTFLPPDQLWLSQMALGGTHVSVHVPEPVPAPAGGREAARVPASALLKVPHKIRGLHVWLSWLPSRPQDAAVSIPQ